MSVLLGHILTMYKCIKSLWIVLQTDLNLFFYNTCRKYVLPWDLGIDVV